MSADGTVYGHDEHALALATALRLDEAVALIKRFGGLAVAAHVDRPTFGSSRSSASFRMRPASTRVELSRHAPAGSAAAAACAEYRLPVVRSSDSHYLEDVGCVATELTLEAPTSPSSCSPSNSARAGSSPMHDLSLYILEMIENSLRAGAGRWPCVMDRAAARRAVDRGRRRRPGLDVSPDQATDPFFTTKAGKKTGLGLPLFREAAEAAGGHLTMHRSRELGGVAIEALLGLSHVDRPPLGDVVETVAVMAATNPQADLTLEVGAGADACLAQGGELAAFGPCRSGAAPPSWRAPTRGRSTRPPWPRRAPRPTPWRPAATSHPTTTAPHRPQPTTKTVDDTVDLRQQKRSVG